MRIGAGIPLLIVFVCSVFLFFIPNSAWAQGPQILEKFEEYDLLSYDLEVQFSTEKNRIAGTQRLDFRPLTSIRSLWLDMGPELKVHKISWEGKRLGFEYLGEVLRIDFPEMLRPEQSYQVEIVYYGNLRGIGAYPVWQKNDKNQVQIGLDAAHLPAYFWWPCKEHGEDKANSMSLSVIVPEEVSLFSSGIPGEKSLRPGNFIRHQLDFPYPVAPDQVSLYIGNFQTLQDTFNNGGQALPLTYFIQPEKKDQAFPHLAQVKKVLSTLNGYFGSFPQAEKGYTWFQPLNNSTSERLFKNNPWGFDPVLVRDIAYQWTTYLPKSSDSLGRRIHESFPYYVEYLIVEKWFNPGSAFRYLDLNKGPNYQKASFLDAMRQKASTESIWFTNLIGFLNQGENGQEAEDYFVEKMGPEAANSLKELLKLKKKPVLSYYFTGKKRKLKLNYCWKNVSPDFSFPISLNVDGEIQKIIPKANWESLTFKGIPQKNITPEQGKVWYRVEEMPTGVE